MTPEWLAERRKGIGGSDVHHVLGEAPYGCPRWLFYDKLAFEPDYMRDHPGFLRRGQLLEPLIADEYSMMTGKKVRRRNQPVVTPGRQWERVNIDRQIVGDARGPGVLECKSMGEWAFGPMKREGLPVAHVLQLQWGLMVTGYTWGAFAILEPASWECLPFEQVRNERLIESVRRAGERFWNNNIVPKIAPDPLPDENDVRCESCEFRRTCRGQIAPQQYLRPEITNPIPKDETLAEIVGDFVAARDARDEAVRTFDIVSDALKVKIGERRYLQVPLEGQPPAKIAFNQQDDGKVWDTDWLDKNRPELFQQAWKRRKGARPLKVTIKENHL